MIMYQIGLMASSVESMNFMIEIQSSQINLMLNLPRLMFENLVLGYMVRGFGMIFLIYIKLAITVNVFKQMLKKHLINTNLRELSHNVDRFVYRLTA